MRRTFLMVSGAMVMFVQLGYAQCGGEERWAVKMGVTRVPLRSSFWDPSPRRFTTLCCSLGRYFQLMR